MTQRVLVTGAAGLVGQNLIAQLARTGEFELVAVDKHPQNTSVLKRLHPQLQIITADLAEPGDWEEVAAGCDAVVMLQAQIGGLDPEAFRRNNIVATERVLAAASRGARPYVAHVSSSVVNSQARDLYTESKKAQEAIVAECGLPHVILRPTLMFGWFDRKHLGWLARFMRRAPVFPIPGDGRYLRQPLYAGDFASIIAVCLRERREGTFNISGQERIDYIDLIRQIRDTVPSLRLDGIVSSGFSISRGKAAEYISAGKCELNYAPCVKGDKQTAESDVITVRGLGKIRLDAVGGNTKNGRICVEITRFL